MAVRPNVNPERIPRKTIFIRVDCKTVDPSYRRDKCIAIKSEWQDKATISTLPGAVWRARVGEWWVDLAQAEEVANVMQHYRLHSTFEELLRSRSEQFVEAKKAWADFSDDDAQELPDYLFKHQARIIHWSESLDQCAIFSDTGTGKTLTGLEMIRRRLKQGRVHRVLIVCPIPLIRAVWEKEAKMWGKRWDKPLKIKSLWHTSGHRSNIALERALHCDKDHIHIVNFATFRQIHKTLIEAQRSKRPLYDAIIVDESSIMKNPSSKITRALLDFSETCNTRILLSGCPAPNTPLEFHSQLAFIDPEILGRSFMTFRERWFDAAFGGSDKWTINDQRFEQLMERIRQVAIFIKKEDCLDLPEQTLMVREVHMDGKQDDIYGEIKDYLASGIDTEAAVIAPNQLAKVMKLRQVTSGHIRPSDMLANIEPGSIPTHAAASLNKLLGSLGIKQDAKPDDFDREYLDPMRIRHLSDAKANDVIDMLEGELANEQAVVWLQFHHEFAIFSAKLNEAGISHGMLYGLTPKRKFPEIEEGFIDGKTRVLLCHPRSVGHGHNWTNASYTIWPSLSYSYEEFKQGRDRIHRHGATKPCTDIVLLARRKDGAASIDHVLLNVIKQKGDVAEAVTSYLRNEYDEDEEAA